MRATLSAELSVEALADLARLDLDPTGLRRTFDAAAAPRLRKAIALLRDARLQRGPGAFLVPAAALATLPEAKRSSAGLALLLALGSPVPQNDAGDLAVRVVDEGQRMTSGGRYHKSNEGGELHTDGPQYQVPPRYIGLVCVRPASVGGASKLVDAHAVHREIEARAPESLAALYQPFHFHQKPGPRTVVAPIFAREEDTSELRIRYLGEYVRSGHAVAGVPLSAEAARALGVLDRVLADDAMALRFSLDAGDVLVIDNHRMLHGREAFEDAGAKREMLRIWVRP